MEGLATQELLRSWLRKVYRQNLLVGSYLSPAWTAAVVWLVVVTAYFLSDIDVTLGLGVFIRSKLEISNILAVTLASVVLWWQLSCFRKFCVRKLLLYRGWLFEGRHVSTTTKIFATLLRIFNGWIHLPTSSAKLYDFQGILPTLPLPAVQDTVHRYVTSMKPLCTPEKHRELQRQAEEFLNTHAPKLQRYLAFKYWSSQNYVSDWWEQYAYLMRRSSLAVNSNFYCLEANKPLPTTNQAARAALYVHGILKFRQSIYEQTLKPLLGQGVIPFCSAQYERLFNTCRVPGEVTDQILHLESSDYIVVLYRGKYFRVHVCHRNGQIFTRAELQVQFLHVIHNQSESQPGEAKLAALTAWDRRNWARTREAHFGTGINKESLDTIEKAAFVVSFDDEEYSAEDDRDDQAVLSHFGRAGLHGNGFNRWFDKSFTFAIGTNGRALCNCEHTWGDAPISARMCQIADADNIEEPEEFDEQGLIKANVKFLPPPPSRLIWDFSPECVEVIEAAAEHAQDLIGNVDLQIRRHNAFGKAFLKGCRVSPDAFIQMALQLAFYREQGYFPQTYEPAMMRFYKWGRTETVRSCTEQSCQWILAMENPSVSRQERLDLFRRACDQHQLNYRLAMSGKGVDRHIFALFVVSQYLKVKDCDFLQNAISAPWPLCTSQTPTWGSTMTSPVKLTSGGGFGPNCPHGYGVSYVFGGEEDLVFHISSYKNSPTTDSTRLWEMIKNALMDIRKLHQDEGKFIVG